MTKELKVEIPEGYEIDKENSTFEKIIFKKLSFEPTNWENYVDNTNFNHTFYMDDYGSIEECHRDNLTYYQARTIYNTKEEAEAFRALMQLRQLRKVWVGNWVPDWNDTTGTRACIVNGFNKPRVVSNYSVSHPLTFPTAEMAMDFWKCFASLIEKAKILI